MATGGDDPKKPSPLKTLFNLERSLTGGSTSPDVIKDVLSDLKPSDRTTSTSNLDPKQSRSDLKTQSRKGSTTSLKTVGTGNPNSMTNVVSGSAKDLGTKPKGQLPSAKLVAEDAVEAEEPYLFAEVSDDDNEPDVLDFDLNLLDPEKENDAEIHTLAAIFPNIQLRPEDLAKDPEPTLKRVVDLKGLTKYADIEKYIQYYKDLCQYRRKIYTHAQMILQKLQTKAYSNDELDDLLFYTENSSRGLAFVNAKLINLYDASIEQKRSHLCGMKNLYRAIAYLKYAVNKAEADRAKAKYEKARYRSDANKAERQTVSTTKVNQPPQVHNSILTESGTGHPGYWPGTGKGERRGERGEKPQRGNDPPFQFVQNDGKDPLDTFIEEFVFALCNKSSDNRPDYRGILKPKLDLFDGDALVYKNWKKWFILFHSPSQNFPDPYLAVVLRNHLRGEARSVVDPYFRTGNYHGMWEQLDLKYGSGHTQFVVPNNPGPESKLAQNC